MNTTNSTFVLSPQAKNLTGMRFGSLTAIKPINQKKRNVVWEFKCDCGNTYISEGCWVTAQHRKATHPLAPSCGCLNRLTTRDINYKHGYYKHPLFWVWVNMVERCHNPNNPNYPSYGAKGVYVCDAWRNSPKDFIEWALANGYTQGLCIDKDILSKQLGVLPFYSPATCKFVTYSENNFCKGVVDAYP